MARISNITVWRWLREEAIRPCRHRCWIFQREPHFQSKAGRILDRYERSWQGQALCEDEFVIATDEKTRIQVRVRKHPSLPSRPGEPMRSEHGVPAQLKHVAAEHTRIYRQLAASDLQWTLLCPGFLVDATISDYAVAIEAWPEGALQTGYSHLADAIARGLGEPAWIGQRIGIAARQVGR